MHKAKKKFGQNFLQDQYIIDHIIQACHITPDEQVLEIGPGLGALSQNIISLARHLHVIEIDRDVIPKLEKILAKSNNRETSNWTITQGDALEFQLNTLASEQKIKVVGNLPYNISTPLLFHFIEQLKHIKDMHFMLQKEVVERICAEPNNKSYGRLSVMLQYHCRCEMLFEVPPESFDPQPKVDSAIIRLTPHAEPPFPCSDETLLSKIVSQAFAQRRKTLRNNLKSLNIQDAIDASGIDASLRAENISVAEYVKLCNIISDSSEKIKE